MPSGRVSLKVELRSSRKTIVGGGGAITLTVVEPVHEHTAAVAHAATTQQPASKQSTKPSPSLSLPSPQAAALFSGPPPSIPASRPPSMGTPVSGCSQNPDVHSSPGGQSLSFEHANTPPRMFALQ